ncbi:MAG TPA: hypothetical protein PLI09_28025 [Candidatus Hydrogenedentes bacterium]|nr:hypothetical protein [Candidatus Hydrogenedentota bacterium]
MIKREWPTKITPEECKERLAIACCALDKIAQWTEEDDNKFGDPGLFARVAIEKVMAPSKYNKTPGGGRKAMNLTDQKNEIKCPFCGYTSIEVDGETGIHAVELFTVPSKQDGLTLYGVKCNWCGANGPLCDGAGMAVAAFTKFSNTKATP